MDSHGGLKTKLIFITSLVILLIVGFGLAKSWQRDNEVNQEISGLNNSIIGLEKDNLELKELVEYFNSDAYIEEKARIDLGLKKAEEKVVIVSNQREGGFNSIEPEFSRANTSDLSNPEKWWLYFFN